MSLEVTLALRVQASSCAGSVLLVLVRLFISVELKQWRTADTPEDQGARCRIMIEAMIGPSRKEWVP